MEEQEVDTEKLHEIIHEKAHAITWAEKVALTTALLAVMAAVSNLFSTHEAVRSVLFKVEGSDQWNYYQAKGIKGMLTQDPAERDRYKEEQEKIREVAEKASEESHHAIHVHEYFAFAVTLFQVATAIGAIAVLTKRKYLWYGSLLLGTGGLSMAIKAISLF